MMGVSMSNDLGLPPPRGASAKPEDPPASHGTPPVSAPSPTESLNAGQIQLEHIFELPTGFIDRDGNLHRRGIMRLARTIDEVAPMRDPRVQDNPAYATVIILSRVITRLGTLPEVSPIVIENLFARDLEYLQNFYRHINGLSS